MTAVLKRAKSQNSAGSFIFLAVGMFIEVIYFRICPYYTMTNKFCVFFSKNPVTLVNGEGSAFCCVNMPPNLVASNISNMSFSVWYFEMDMLVDIGNINDSG